MYLRPRTVAKLRRDEGMNERRVVWQPTEPPHAVPVSKNHLVTIQAIRRCK